jgi:riboflavin kinase / FMN adenylyltransferase
MPPKNFRVVRDGAPAGALRGAVVAIGNFDGVHRGHQALFARARTEARARHLVPVALTFDPHPRVVLGGEAPPLLTSTAHKVALVAQHGVAHVFIRRFDKAFSEWTPEHFVESLLVGELHAKVVIAGENFRFGKKRAGDAALLRALGPKLGFEAFTLEETDARGPLSSSRARDAVLAGDLDEARDVLGREHVLVGVVEKGDQRGRTLGFPTANLGGVAELVPKNGVYAALVDSPSGSPIAQPAPAVMNIGMRPTIAGDGRRMLEVHLLDYDGDLYGKALRVRFVARLRDEQKFDGLSALKAQIARDVEAARVALGSPDATKKH